MKPCKFEEQAHLYPFGVLSAREKERFEAHMKECAACRAIVEEAGAIRTMAAAMEPAEPLAGLEDRILNRFPDRGATPAVEPRWEFLRRWQRALIPASALVSLVLLVVVLRTSPNKVPASQPAAQAAASATADTPSEYLVESSLDTTQQSYLADDPDTALGNYYDSLIVTN